MLKFLFENLISNYNLKIIVHFGYEIVTFSAVVVYKHVGVKLT